MTTKPVDTKTVHLVRLSSQHTKLVTRRMVAQVGGGMRAIEISLPPISMHMAALEAQGHKVRRGR